MDINEQYSIKFTSKGISDMTRIYNYIKKKLQNEIAAENLIRKTEKYIAELKYSPHAYRELRRGNLKRKAFRKIKINNYILMYTVDEDKKQVTVSHMFYARSNYINKI